jgi:hypothetical protein
VYRKVSRLLLFNCLSERRLYGRSRLHFRKPIASAFHVPPRCEHALFSHECFFDFIYLLVSGGWQNRATCLHRQKDRKCIKNRELAHEDRRLTTHELADVVGSSYGVCQQILTEIFNMHHIAAKFVPRLLINGQTKNPVISLSFPK